MTFLRSARRLLLVSLLVYLALKGLFLSGLVTGYIQQIILYCFIVILTSIGLNVIYGYTGQFSLGHAAFYGIGAYASACVTTQLHIENPLLFLPSLLFGGAAAGAVVTLSGSPSSGCGMIFLPSPRSVSVSWSACCSTTRTNCRRPLAVPAASLAYRKSRTSRWYSSRWFFSSS